jgi:hypothetical protein
LREFYQEASAKAGAKRGAKRRDLDVTASFVPLLRWVLSLWSCRRLFGLDHDVLGSDPDPDGLDTWQQARREADLSGLPPTERPAAAVTHPVAPVPPP